ncbi:hypothetical protein C1I98_13315 [Spongiactinospora gelatinilytica]|uniref:Uncharacterized protein n=1 Tax=Spongiactinospora gelatinilytica TaxID=2666298 RepID=A0A2W2HNF6_9ACTN|nr:hypothetical protein [Spongiactinospora gelatinilytica]PZG47447.1 hypothetical protein C1I98_13315 [Spongiactinospora gelatinilytica]
MCENCWDKYGRQADWNPRVEQAVALIHAICDEEITGGPLHYVISNWNVRGTIAPCSASDYSPEVERAANELAALFNEMPEPERAAALAYAQGYATLTPGA